MAINQREHVAIEQGYRQFAALFEKIRTLPLSSLTVDDLLDILGAQQATSAYPPLFNGDVRPLIHRMNRILQRANAGNLQTAPEHREERQQQKKT